MYMEGGEHTSKLVRLKDDSVSGFPVNVTDKHPQLVEVDVSNHVVEGEVVEALRLQVCRLENRAGVASQGGRGEAKQSCNSKLLLQHRFAIFQTLAYLHSPRAP